MRTEQLHSSGDGLAGRRGRGFLRLCGSIIGRAAWVAAGIAWGAGRLLLGALLVLLEPLLRIILVPLAHLGVLLTLFFGFVVGDPRFPRWGMLAFSVGALVLYWMYLGLVALVLGGRRGRD